MSEHRTPNLNLPWYDADDAPNGAVQQQALAEAADQIGAAPVGAMMMWPAAAAPAGWLLMQGQQVTSAQYPGLAAVLGAVSGQVTIPDMRDTFPVGASAAAALGSRGGAASVTLTAAQSGMPAHNHGGATGSKDRSTQHFHGGPAGGPTLLNATAGSPANLAQTGAAYAADYTGGGGDMDHLHTISGEAARNATGAHENRPPYAAVNFIIRAG